MTTDKTKRFFRVSAEDFKKIPGSPIVYWLSPAFLNAFSIYSPLSQEIQLKAGLSTGDNTLFERFWFEVSLHDISFSCCSLEETNQANPRWYPCHSGGEFRKWYGNHETVINWQNNGLAIRNFGRETGKIHSAVRNDEFYFRSGLTWSKISSGIFSVRYRPEGFIFDDTGRCGFAQTQEILHQALGLLNSRIASSALAALSPTLSFTSGEIAKIPYSRNLPALLIENTQQAVKNTRQDWDSYETSWDFQENPLIQEAKATAKPSKAGEGLLSSHAENGEYLQASRPLADIYVSLRLKWRQQTEEMRRLETENNRIFIDAYGLQDELSPEVPWNEITLTCNPWYRYGKTPENADLLGNGFYLNHSTAQIKPTSKQEEDCPDGNFPFAHDTEQRLLEDTIKEFISYAVGCMMGRYSPEKPGLILANQGDGFVRYHEIMSGKNSDEIMLISDATKAELRSAAGETLADNEAYRKSRQDRCPMPASYQIRDFISSRYHVICDRDGVIPILDDEWFVDDIVAQFKDFLKLTFGNRHYADNLDFIEKTLGKDIRKYFLKDFYRDHIQRYKTRPVYWMFSSPKGSFNALIYMHRYRPDTVSIVLNEYLREFIAKIRIHREHLITENNRTGLSASEKTANLKQIDKYAAMLTELDAYERDILFPLAQEKIDIDLDDGVKVNYCKFGAALKNIPGLEAKEK